jgi:hypothetical protein
MKYTWILLILLLIITEDNIHSQKLPAPRIYLVTVAIESQLDSIIWFKIPAPPFDPTRDYYVVAERLDPSPGQPESYNQISPGILDTFYLNNNVNTSSSEEPIGYTVWGMHPNGVNDEPGDFNKPDSTMYLKSVFDSCAGTITLTWNDYNTWRGSTTGFTIYRRTAPGVYVPLTNVNPDITITRYTLVLGNILQNQTYDLFIEAANSDGIRRSNSNRASVFTKWTVQTGTINADYATISAENTIDLSFTARGALGQDKYRLLRSNVQGGTYIAIDSIITSDTIIHFNDDTPFVSGIYYYRLEMLNNCGTMFSQSNLANNVILAGTQSGSVVSLSWNKYSDWLGGVERYRIVRTIGQTNPLVDTLDGGTLTAYTDDVAALIDYSNPASSFICYHIDALQGSNIYGIQENSISNQVCFTVIPDIRMPNAFIPNDGEPVNRVFEPVFSFIPEHYEMIIYNRLGTKLWEGTGPWDGIVAGKPVPEGVYLYLLRIYNYSSDVKEINGKVVVVYR